MIVEEARELFPQLICVTRCAHGRSGFKDPALNIYRKFVPQQERRGTETMQDMLLFFSEWGQSATLAFPSGEGAKITRASAPSFLVAHTIEL